MAFSPSEVPTRISRSQRKAREERLRGLIEAAGGKLLRINWKKRTAHFINRKGNKQTAYAA